MGLQDNENPCEPKLRRQTWKTTRTVGTRRNVKHNPKTATVAKIGKASLTTNPAASMAASEQQEEVQETNKVTSEESVGTTTSVRDKFEKLSPDNLPLVHSFLAHDEANDDNVDATEKLLSAHPYLRPSTIFNQVLLKRGVTCRSS